MPNILFHTLPLSDHQPAEFLPLNIGTYGTETAPNFSPLTPNFSPLNVIYAEFLPLNDVKTLISFAVSGGNTILEHKNTQQSCE